MDLKEFKRLVSYSRKAGLKKVKFSDIEFEFNETLPKLTKTQAKAVEEFKSNIAEVPSLDKINDWIYKQEDEAS